MSEKGKALFEQAGGKLLTFMLGGREYGLQILDAREVVGMIEAEPVPQTPEFMKGVINLRGQIVPVIDLRARFHIPIPEQDTENCILVVDLAGRMTGCIIDSLIGVTTIEPSQFEDSPQMGANIHTDYMTGLAKLDKRVIIILDMSRILQNEELAHLEVMAKAV
ncbi:MAG: chemotaxis protein CheW [bacterium]|nr:chemotaxis protein CheW [bacterium]